MKKKNIIALGGLLIGLLVLTGFVLDRSKSEQAEAIFIEQERVEPRQKKDIDSVKGLYLTAVSADNAVKLQQIIDLINKTELNAVVIDIKDYTGYVLYDSNLPAVNDLQTEKIILKDPKAVLQKLSDNNIYTIARQTVFQDPILAKQKSEWAIKTKKGNIWKDNKGLSWVDPANQEVWKYNLDIAREAIELGFDEINFDYVRFPTDGNLASANLPLKQEKNLVMSQFFQYLNENLKDEPAWISLDFFGFVMDQHDGINIGQTLSGAVDFVDFISPMMYPSHYPKGYIGLENPAASPGPVIHSGMAKGIPYFENKRARVRPWLQAFNIGAMYGARNIRAQIDAVEQFPNAGWLLWNAVNRYSEAGLRGE